MPAAIDVRPVRWTEVKVIYDNGWYSAISGTYRNNDGSTPRNVGTRWNGSGSEVGFPSSRRYPQWHVEPHILAGAIVRRLLELSQDDPSQAPYLRNLEDAVEEFG